MGLFFTFGLGVFEPFSFVGFDGFWFIVLGSYV